jgi:hypothetical protein
LVLEDVNLVDAHSDPAQGCGWMIILTALFCAGIIAGVAICTAFGM